MCRRKLLNSILVLGSALYVTTATAQTIEWVPVSSTGPSSIVGNEIILPAGVAQVQFDIVVYGWGGAPLYEDLGAYTATLVGADLLGVNASPPNPGVDLTTPEQVPCQSEADCPTGRCGSFQAGFCDDNQPGFQFARMCLNDQSLPCSTGSQCASNVCIPNADFVLSGCDPALAVALPANRNYEFIGACQSSLVVDTGIPRYAGSLRIDVPVNAEGTYEITFNPSNERTFLNVFHFVPMSLTLTSGIITLPTDCNNNGVLDDEEIASGQARDCDGNGLPDDCDSGDCNDNGRPDHCDILIGLSRDCNDNELPDECEQIDCNDNNTLDSCDIDNMTSTDCNSDGVPDECQLVANDCNDDDVPDDCQLVANDCNLNGVPDSCDPDNDCDTNGVQDICDVAAGAPDCNFNEVPDECEPDEDCNTNGVRDICDIGAGTALDCNGNSIPDGCDLTAGSSPDSNGNSVPDECEVAAPPVPDVPHHWRKNRFISFTPLVTNNMPVSYRVELLDHLCLSTGEKCTASSDCTVCIGGSRAGKPCSHGSECPASNCVVSGEPCVENSPPIALGWVGDPSLVPEDSIAGIPPDLFTSLVVKDQPSARLWPEEVIHVGDCEIAPAQSYAVSATMDGIVFSDPLLIGTVPKPLDKSWGDVVGTILDTDADGMGDTWTAPNGLSNVDDVVAWLRFKAGRLAPHITAMELDSEVPNFIANVTDLALILQGFKGRSYPPPPFPTKVCVGGNDGVLCSDNSTCAGGTCTGWDPRLCP